MGQPRRPLVGRAPVSALHSRIVRRGARRRRRAVWPYLLPMFAVLALVAGWPLLRTIYFSFTDATLATLHDYRFVGLLNFAYLAQDPVWWRAVWNTLVFTVVSVGLETMLGLVAALALNTQIRGRGLLRAAMLIPWAIPTIVSAQMWRWMYNDLYGVINAAFLHVGLIDHPYAWTADPALALGAVIAVDVWKATPFMMLLILAALQTLPKELFEAAKVDGVPALVVFFRVTLPLIWPALLVAILFRTLDALRVFDLIYVLTSNSRNTMSMSVYARQYLIDFQDVGFGSAAATALFLVVAMVVAVGLMAGRLAVRTDGPGA